MNQSGTRPSIGAVQAGLTDDLVEAIDSWRASAGPHEIGQRTDWRRLAENPVHLERTAQPSHFTASALPATADGARVCLVLHRRLGLWVQPGGHFEPGDATVAAAASREMHEETGLTGSLSPVPLRLSRHPAPCGIGAWHLDVQLLAVTPDDSPVVSDESLDVAWFEVDDLPREMASGVEGLIAAAVTRLQGSDLPGPLGPGR